MERTKSITVELDYPVDADGTQISQLTFRRMKAGDALVGEGEESQTRAGYRLFAALAGVDVSVIEDLDIEDLEKIGEAIVPLMGKSAAAATAAERAKLSAGAS